MESMLPVSDSKREQLAIAINEIYSNELPLDEANSAAEGLIQFFQLLIQIDCNNEGRDNEYEEVS